MADWGSGYVTDTVTRSGFSVAKQEGKTQRVSLLRARKAGIPMRAIDPPCRDFAQANKIIPP